MMMPRKIFARRRSNVSVAVSVSPGVIVPPAGAVVENDLDEFVWATSGRLCVPGWPVVFWLNLPWPPEELFAGCAGGRAGVAVGGGGDAVVGGGGVSTPGLAPESFR